MDLKTRPRVFITQIPSRKEGDRWLPTVDISTAEFFGEVVIMLPPSAAFFAGQNIVEELKRHLATFTHDDYFLPMGDPMIMAVGGGIAARRANGSLKVLKWDKMTKKYLAYKLENVQ
jgi:hypothetical protein